jgi:predicted permease
LDKVLNVAGVVVPVLVALALGFIIKKKSILSAEGIYSIKKLVLNVTLPAVLFNAYLTIDYNIDALIVFATMFGATGLALGVGVLVRKLFRYRREYFPYLLTTFEVGMIGYALYTMVFGMENINSVAIVDLGQVTFVFTAYMTILNYKGTGKAGNPLLTMFKSPVFIAIFLGVILGVTGANKAITGSDAGSLLVKTISFIAAPTSGAIMIVIGYELNLSRHNLKGALMACLSRLVLMGAFCAMILLLLPLLMPVSPYLMWAIILVFCLPPVYVLPIFVKDEKENEYISTTISVYTLVTIILFIIIASVATN